MNIKTNNGEKILFFLQLIVLWIRSSSAIESPLQDHNSTAASPVRFTSDSCDWYGFGDENEGAITPVYLRCAQGNIRWKYPRGGLRILIHPTPEMQFQGCIRIAKKSNANVKLSVEEKGPKLKPLYHLSDGYDSDMLRCFNSVGNRVALLVEVIPTSSVLKGELFEIDYHLTAVEETNKVTDSDDHDCRPCSDDELVHYYCNSDFLVRGTIESINENRALARSDITIKVDSNIRESSKNSLSDHSKERPVILHRPLKCHSKSPGSSTEFLFMGQWILGNPVMKCAPKWSQWKHVRLRAIHAGSAQCRLGWSTHLPFWFTDWSPFAWQVCQITCCLCKDCATCVTNYMTVHHDLYNMHRAF